MPLSGALVPLALPPLLPPSPPLLLDAVPTQLNTSCFPSCCPGAWQDDMSLDAEVKIPLLRCFHEKCYDR